MNLQFDGDVPAGARGPGSDRRAERGAGRDDRLELRQHQGILLRRQGHQARVYIFV